MTLVSILIPAHNEESRIGTVIKAILNQDYPNIEIIVIDNASSDRTAEVVKNFSGQRFLITVLREENKGTNFALECGRRSAKGELIARIDADCIPDSTWVSRAAKYFENPKNSGVTGPYDYYDAGFILKIFCHLNQRYIYSTINHLFQIFHQGAILIGGNSMVRAKDLEKIGGFDTSIVFYGDDTDLVKKLSKIGHIVFDKDLKMKSSARRFKKEGFIKILYLYIKGFIKMTFRK